MKRTVFLLFLTLLSFYTYSRNLSKPLKENLSDKKMFLIFEKNIKKLSRENFLEDKKIPVPIKNYIFVTSIIGMSNNQVGIKRNEISAHPWMDKNDFYKLVDWYNRNKDKIRVECFVMWWNFYANLDSTLEDLERAEQCVVQP